MLIIESRQEQIFEAVESAVPDGGLMVLEGTFAVMNVINGNNRQYTKANYDAVIAPLKQKIERKSLLGELEHVKRDIINYNDVSHRIDSVNYDDASNSYKGRITLLDTPKGRIAYGIAKAGSPLYISSRAHGGIDKRSNTVQLSKLITWDLVAEPGFGGENPAMMTPVYESLGDGLWAIDKSVDVMTELVALRKELNEMRSINESSASSSNFVTVQMLDGYVNKVIIPKMQEFGKSVEQSAMLCESVGTTQNDVVTIDMLDAYMSNVVKPFISEKHLHESMLDKLPQDTITKMQQSLVDGSSATTSSELSSTIIDRVKNILSTFVPAEALDAYIKDELMTAIDEKIRTSQSQFVATLDSWIQSELIPELRKTTAEQGIPSGARIASSVAQRNAMKLKLVTESNETDDTPQLTDNLPIQITRNNIAIDDTVKSKLTAYVNVADSTVAAAEALKSQLSDLLPASSVLSTGTCECFQQCVIVEYSAESSVAVLNALKDYDWTAEPAMRKISDSAINESRAALKASTKRVEPYMAHMPQRFKAIYEALDDIGKNALRKQAEMRNLAGDSWLTEAIDSRQIDVTAVTKFWETRNFNALKKNELTFDSNSALLQSIRASKV